MENYMSQRAELRLQFQYVYPSMDKIYALSHPGSYNTKNSKNPLL